MSLTQRDKIDAAWIPVRFVREDRKCSFCGARIPKGAPGASKGTRGTKAWWNKVSNRWECMGCRSEGFRAEDERRTMERVN
jgi:hypothetical protein